MDYMRGGLRKALFRQARRRLGERRARLWQQRLSPLRAPLDQLAASTRLWRLRQRTFPWIRVSHSCLIEGYGLLIRGQLQHPPNQTLRIDLLLQGHDPIPLSEPPYRHRLSAQNEDSFADLGPQGFVMQCRWPQQADVNTLERAAAEDQLYLRVRNDVGVIRHCLLTPQLLPAGKLDSVRRLLLQMVPPDHADRLGLFDAALGQAIQATAPQRTAKTRIGKIIEYNEQLQSSEPMVSILVPIYGRDDFIEYQLSRFCNDPFLKLQDLIYIIDDPRLLQRVESRCQELAAVYPIPFRVLYLPQNLGYASANNAGFQYSRAPWTLLLNSDVMPRQTGWLQIMLDTATAGPRERFVGARLLYPNDTLQHDGMRFERDRCLENLWTNHHPGKGLPLDVLHPAVDSPEPEALTGACLLMLSALYQELDGLDETYLIGDFEDSDLCLRAREHGIEMAMARDAVLYHFEGQSQQRVGAERWRADLSFYNGWLHQQRWCEQIEALKARSSTPLINAPAHQHRHAA